MSSGTLKHHPYALKEAAAVAVAGASTLYSTGVNIDRASCPNAVGLAIVVAAGPADVSLVVQTADGSAVAADWNDTTDRENNKAAAGTYRIEMASPVLDKLRLRITDAGGGAYPYDVQVYWLYDQGLSLI